MVHSSMEKKSALAKAKICSSCLKQWVYCQGHCGASWSQAGRWLCEAEKGIAFASGVNRIKVFP